MVPDSAPASMQTELAAYRAQLRGLDQRRVGHGDGVERSLELLQPERQKAVQHRKSRTEVVVLPDIGLQQGRMIGEAVEDLRRGEAIAFELAAEIFGREFLGSKSLRCHGCPPIRTSSLLVTSHTNKHKKWRKFLKSRR